MTKINITDFFFFFTFLSIRSSARLKKRVLLVATKVRIELKKNWLHDCLSENLIHVINVKVSNSI